MAVELKLLLPEWFKGILEFNNLMESEAIELQEAEKNICEVRNNCYILTASVQGIKRWESLLGIKPYIEESIEERRLAVLAKWNQHLPYTRIRLQEWLDSVLGKNSYLIYERFQLYEFELIVFDQTYRMLQDVRETTREMIPANLVFIFAGRYPVAFMAGAAIDVRMKMGAEFYPRYNLAHHLWEGEHLLDGGKYLNGYDSAALVDFYPVVQVISVDVLPDVKEEPILCSTADVCCKTAMDVENTVMADVMEDAGLSTGAWIAGDVDVLPEEAVRIVVVQGTAIKTEYVTASGFHADVPKSITVAWNQLLGSTAEVLSEQRTSMGFKAGVAERVISEANGTYYRAEASAAPKAVGTGTVGAAYPVGADYQNKLTVEKNLRYLEGMRTLSGAGLLNAEIIDYTL